LGGGGAVIKFWLKKCCVLRGGDGGV
jgi:hypothetical protein